jgi:ribosomal protein S18 acetylase RimI-like enzyme
MVTHAAKQAAARQGIRRLDPLRDLAQVADVIEEGFGHDLTEPGWKALREMRFVSRLGPLLWWLAATSPDFREYHSGFVWLEEGQVVGTLNITRPGLYARQWLISNVAVRAEYRGRGIARALMEAALAWAGEQGGEAVLLRVRRDNAAARSLYRHLGFQLLHDTVNLRLARAPLVREASAPGTGTSLAPYRSRQWRQVFELARLIVPVELRWLESVSVAEFNLSLEHRLAEWWADLTGGHKVYRLVAQRGERVVAAMAIKVACRRGSHLLTLHVHPDHRGEVEETLVTEALVRLWPYRDRSTFVTLPIGYAEILDVLKRYGFVEQKALTLMRRSLAKFNQ